MASEIDTFLDQVAEYLNGKPGTKTYEVTLVMLIEKLTPQRLPATARMLKFMGIKPQLNIATFFEELERRDMQVIENAPYVRFRLLCPIPPDSNFEKVLRFKKATLTQALYEAERRLGK